MPIPSVAQLIRPTLELVANEIDDPDSMRKMLAGRFEISPRDLAVSHGNGMTLFVNNHAFALVRLQADRLIEKTGDRRYGLTETGERAIFGNVEGDYRVPPPRLGEMPSWARTQINAANSRNRKSRRSDRTFDERDLIRLWDRADGRCQITHATFSLEPVGTGRARRPYAPSLDRIDPDGIYEPDNLRLIMVGVNFGINAWGLETYLRLASAATRTNIELIRDLGFEG